MPQASVSLRPASARRAFALSTLSLAVLLGACGGGGGGDPAASTQGFSSGPISGFGSIIVNGIRYEDGSASVIDDEGDSVSRSSDDPLQLGVVVEVVGRVNDDGISGTASRFEVRSGLKGPVEAKNSLTDTLTVLGTPVRVTATTIYQGVSGFAGLVAGSDGQVVEVHGLPGADGTLVATRIELESPTVSAYGGDYRVRGSLSGLAGTAPSQTFRVGAVDVRTDALTRLNGSLVEGALVSVRLAKTPVAGVYTASRVQLKTRGFARDDRYDRAEIEGLVTAFTSINSFEVNGYPVTTSDTTVFEDGRSGVVLGARVDVDGTVVNGVLQARKVELDRFDSGESGDDRDGDDRDDAPFEFKGVASAVSGTASAGTFTVRGQSIDYDSRTVFRAGLSAASFSGVNVEVDAVSDSSSGAGTRFLAVRIERRD